MVPDSVLAVLVVYERRLGDVACWSELQRWLQQGQRHGLQLRRVLIYDNSTTPAIGTKPPTSPDISYVHDATNGGTAAAYGHASQLATQTGCEWLLLLDHDTELSNSFLDTATQCLRNAEPEKPAALVPRVRHGNRLISPAYLTRFGSVRPLQEGHDAAASQCLTAIASGALLRTSCLQAMLPFPNRLWLDYVDHWIFTELHKQQACVRVFQETLVHDLSIENPAQLSPLRLVSILDGEALLHRQLGTAARAIYPVRLAVRMLRYIRSKPSLATTLVHWAFNRTTGQR